MASDKFGTYGSSPIGSFEAAEAIVLDTDFTFVSRGIWVGTGGDVSVVMKSGATVVFTNIADGTVLPVRATQVTTANTTASDLVAGW